jgi:hypothetical protein
VVPTLSQRYVAALAQLSQFICVQGDKTTLTHVLSGVQVSPHGESETAGETSFLHLDFGGGRSVQVHASLYLELMLAEDAAHQMHAASEGSGEIHRRAKEKHEHLAKEYGLES